MVGCGAWLASLLLIGFVASIGIGTDAGVTIIGAVLIGGAILARRNSASDFIVQGSLACSLAGQALFAFGIVELTDSDGFEGILAVVSILSSILFFIFPDRIHRVLCVLIASVCLAVLLYIWEQNAIVPVIGPAIAMVMVYFYVRQGYFMQLGYGHLIRPLITGLMLSAFGFMLLSTVYLLPELGADFQFYPRPWISSIMLGGLFLSVGAWLWPQLGDAGSVNAKRVCYALTVLVIAAAWAVPGMLLALIVVLLGAATGNRVFAGAGIVFLALFIAAYFYGIQVTMLTKSMTLAATGAAVLLARWLLLKMLRFSSQEQSRHA
jgi:hypothetical protein